MREYTKKSTIYIPQHQVEEVQADGKIFAFHSSHPFFTLNSPFYILRSTFYCSRRGVPSRNCIRSYGYTESIRVSESAMRQKKAFTLAVSLGPSGNHFDPTHSRAIVTADVIGYIHVISSRSA